jgi:hypothetical protein
VNVAKSMWSPLDKYQEICESRSAKIVKIVQQFAENFIIIHRNIKRLRDKLIPDQVSKLEMLKKIEQEIRFQLSMLEEEEEVYFGPPSVPALNSKFISKSLDSKSMDETLEKKLISMLPPEKQNPQNIKLLYRSSRDGKGADVFHRLCDNKGPTITVIKDTNGNVFGGYTSQSWHSNRSYCSDSSSFVFTLKNPYNLPAQKFGVTNNTNAIFCGGDGGPAFGGGGRIDNGHGGSCYTKLGSTYSNPTGYGSSVLTGSFNFTPAEVEVFSL